MTSAYLQQLGRREFQPTGTSGPYQDNYASIDPDLEEAANKRIDENTEALRQTFRSLGEYYNQIYDRRARLPTEILNFTKAGFQLKQDVESLNKFNKEMNAFEATFQPGGLSIADTKDVRLNRPGTTDSEVKNFENAEYQQHANLKDRVDLAYSTEDREVRRQLLADNVHDFKRRYQSRTAGDVIRNFDIFVEENQNILMIDLSEMGINKKVLFSKLEGEAQRKFGFGKLTNYYLAAHQDIVGSNRGKFKRDVVVPILNKRNNWLHKAALDDAKAIDQANIRDRKDELILGLRTKGPGYFVDHINIHKGAHRNSYIITRKESAETVAEIAEAGGFTRGEIEEINNEPFEAHDGSIQTIAKYWPKEAQTMLNGVGNFETAQYEFEVGNRKAQSEGIAFNQVELLKEKGRKGEVTIEDVNNSVTAWSAQTGKPRSEAPAILKDFPYAGSADDASLDQIYTNRLANGGTLSEKDILALKDPDLKNKYRNEMARRGGIGDSRKSFLTKATDTHFQNKLGEAGRDLDWYFTNESIAETYANKFEEVLDKTGSAAQAKSEAQKAVLDELQQDADGKIDLSRRKDVPQDLSFTNDVQAAKTQLSKDPTLVNSPNPWKGEAVHLKMAAEYLKSGGRSPRPYFYWKFTNGIPMAPELLLRQRLRAVGAIKENDYQLPEEVHLTVKEQRSIKNSTPSSVYKLTQKQKDINWMLREVQDDTAVDGEDGQPGKGYDHIRNSNGDIVELEKPLSQHTIDEVIDLLNQGYTDFGIYGISNDGLRSIILESPINLNRPFDQSVQDLLVLARLRQKSQQAQKYSTVNAQYRRLVNIDPEDEQRFLDIVGDLPPYLRLSNLLPAVAKEMVDQTLQ